MRIAVDAMGGDHAPDVVVQGALQAVAESGVEITLVGDREAIESRLAGARGRPLPGVHHCGEMVLMDEHPLNALRRKKDASIRVAFDLVKRGEADAVVSAGNSGATLAASVLSLGRIDGVERPGFAGIFPADKGSVVLIDVGAAVDCLPVHLFHFGVMAHVFATSCLGMEEPAVGLLNIGQEGDKGNEQVRQAHDLFRASPLNFVGNVEGRDILSGNVQIVVCDGFVGNVALKLMEGVAETLTGMIETEMMGSPAGRLGLLFGRRVFRELKERLDYAAYGGAPILGVKGVGIVCHGGSSAKAVKNAVKMADRYAKNQIHERLFQDLARFQPHGAGGRLSERA